MRYTTKTENGYKIFHLWDERNSYEDEHKEDFAINKLGQVEDILEKHTVKSVNDLDKRLIVLDIIKEKRVCIYFLGGCDNVDQYNDSMDLFDKMLFDYFG